MPAVAVFLVIVALAFAAVLGVISSQDKDRLARVRVAVTGDTDSKYLKLGIAAAEAIDSSRYSLELVTMDQDEAKKALSSGDIAAYAVFPKGFIRGALSGKVAPVKIVSTGDGGVASLFKDEITRIITDIYCAAQRGVYGVADALSDNGGGDIAEQSMNELLFDYVDVITSRDGMYDIKELGFSDGFSRTEYYIGAVGVLILLIAVIPLCPLYVSDDTSFCNLASSRGIGCIKQVVCETAALSLPFAAVAVIVGAVCGIGVFSLVPAVVTLTLFGYLLWQLSGSTVSAILLHFFVTVAMCYASGCFYPLGSLPTQLQAIGRALPAGVCAEYVSGLFAGYCAPMHTVICGAGLFVLCVVTRACRRRWNV